jgi:hypothetical protein
MTSYELAKILLKNPSAKVSIDVIADKQQALLHLFKKDDNPYFAIDKRIELDVDWNDFE